MVIKNSTYKMVVGSDCLCLWLGELSLVVHPAWFGVTDILSSFISIPPFLLSAAMLELTGPHDIEGTWKSSITLPCVYVPSQDFVQQTVIWTLDRDQSPSTVFRRDSSGDHIMLSRYRGRLSIPKYRPGDVSLEIEKLEIPDSGHYTCKVTWTAQNNSLLTRERTTTVKVVKGKSSNKPLHLCSICQS